MRSDEFDTAEFFRRLERQVADLQTVDPDDRVRRTGSLDAVEETTASDTTPTGTRETAEDGFTWGQDAWGFEQW